MKCNLHFALPCRFASLSCQHLKYHQFKSVTFFSFASFLFSLLARVWVISERSVGSRVNVFLLCGFSELINLHMVRNLQGRKKYSSLATNSLFKTSKLMHWAKKNYHSKKENSNSCINVIYKKNAVCSKMCVDMLDVYT